MSPLAPPLAFPIYVILVAVLAGMGRLLAGPGVRTPLKRGTYAGGEAGPAEPALPGYQPFFAVALFFAVLHLGVLVLATGNLAPLSAAYALGLLVVLAALVLG